MLLVEREQVVDVISYAFLKLSTLPVCALPYRLQQILRLKYLYGFCRVFGTRPVIGCRKQHLIVSRLFIGLSLISVERLP